MATATIFEARNNFSQMVKRASMGETITIASGREKTPIAKLMPIEPVGKRRLGFMEHLGIAIPESFFDPLPEEELRRWNGESD